MNKKLLTYLIPVFIGSVILLGILYFVSLIWQGDQRKEASLDEFKGSRPVFSSKKEAYDAYLSDSILNVREENVSVDLNSLFSSRTRGGEELIPEEGAAAGPDESKASQVAENKTAVLGKPGPQSALAKATYKPKTIDEPRRAVPAPEPAVEPKRQQRRESFNSFSQSPAAVEAPEKPTMIKAVVHSRQQVHTGSTVKLRSIGAFYIEGVAVPENTFIYGTVSIQGERVLVTVNSVNVNGNILSARLRAYDRDGAEGVYIPGLARHELKNGTVEGAITETEAALNVPRVATGAMNVARGLNRQESAILTDNYQLVLK